MRCSESAYRSDKGMKAVAKLDCYMTYKGMKAVYEAK